MILYKKYSAHSSKFVAVSGLDGLVGPSLIKNGGLHTRLIMFCGHIGILGNLRREPLACSY